MKKFISATKTFMADEGGVTAIEYGLIAALIATALITAVGYITLGLSTAFSKIQTVMQSIP
ncbi:Flp family type IVb pilin [Massilia glaciei]|uniref:Flp family type IVb pilin n=1 Tax=Massilia glaciei TaxID=1524097 RepID=A0A2U2I699_9BURK|nr:Flp family type IVb pilin [Massilia glaciei]PWF55185.1 Flp family type IVb pilin [Massilia glaciei]